jgi:hypothetical protein
LACKLVVCASAQSIFYLSLCMPFLLNFSKVCLYPNLPSVCFGSMHPKRISNLEIKLI